MNKIAGFDSPESVRSFPAGTEIFRESDPADFLYVIVSGEVEMRVKGNVVLTLHESEVFGETALIESGPRLATAAAKTNCQLIALDEEAFKRQVGRNPEFALQVMRVVFARMAALSSVRIDSRVLEHFARPAATATGPGPDVFSDPDLGSERARIFLLSRMSLFSQLEREELKSLAASLKLRELSPSETIMKAGDEGESMFVVARGKVDVRIVEPQTKEEFRVAGLGPGEFFGEMALLTHQPRSATVVAATDVLLYEISRSDMEELFRARPEVLEIVSWILARRRQENLNNLQKALREHSTEQEVSMAREQILAKLRETLEKREG